MIEQLAIVDEFEQHEDCVGNAHMSEELNYILVPLFAQFRAEENLHM